ncbi:helix-turn-helix domain-containing protein [Chryseobacterium sp. SIMBA_028]|uniref:helix-turn-helix domain-containing protein n=1 Tax=Chryseobacterium sp. SIMBA_028 TaxID=3085771 RepID=UPI00397B6E7C
MKKLLPDYKLIYQDMIKKKYPHKEIECRNILKKDELSILDVMELNKIIFNAKNRETDKLSQRLRSYDKTTILEILHYQKVNNLNNIQVARKFNLSRNSIGKWKKMFFSVNC